MGAYDTYGHTQAQIKMGPLEGTSYLIGADVPIPNGIYITYEGIVIIHNGKLLDVFGPNTLRTKWGDNIRPHDILDKYNPVCQVINAYKKEGG